MTELDVLMQIEDNTASQESQLNYIVDNTEALKEYTQELISGDIKIINNQQQTINLLGAEIMVLMGILLYLFIVRSLK